MEEIIKTDQNLIASYHSCEQLLRKRTRVDDESEQISSISKQVKKETLPNEKEIDSANKKLKKSATAVQETSKQAKRKISSKSKKINSETSIVNKSAPNVKDVTKKRKCTDEKQLSASSSKNKKEIRTSKAKEIRTKPNTSKMKRLTNKNMNSIFGRKKIYQSPSSKFENQVPKVDDLLRDLQLQDKLSVFDKILKDESRIFRDSLLKKKTERKKSTKCLRFMDCKHLTLHQLTKKLKKDVNYLDDIFHGKVFNERHERFKNCPQEKQVPENDLRCNEVTRAFTDEQLIHIVTFFRNRYDNGNKYKWSDYYFKVLLPEYCIKIFMDYYNMSYDNAMEYLESLPVTVHID